MLENITPESYPHDQFSMMMVMAYYNADAFKKADKLSQIIKTNLEQDIKWIHDLPEGQAIGESDDLRRDEGMLQQLGLMKEDASKHTITPSDANVQVKSGMK